MRADEIRFLELVRQMRAAQKAYFKRRHAADLVEARRLPFYAKRVSSRHPWHLMLFGDRGCSLCGQEIDRVSPSNRAALSYARLPGLAAAGALCGPCLAAWRGIEERERAGIEEAPPPAEGP